MVALLYVMARDRELPETFTHLNRFGVPWVPLIAATVFPVIVLNVDDSVEGLMHLYAIGVVGAITINLGSCAFATQIRLAVRERWIMKITALVLAAIWITIAVSKLPALLFMVIVLGVGLIFRQYALQQQRAGSGAPPAEALTVVPQTPQPTPPPTLLGETILVSARGWTPALQFALEACRMTGAKLLVLHIREVAVLADLGSDWKQDPAARELFTRVMASAGQVKIHPLYSVSDSAASTIIDIAATFGADTVVLGGSRRATLVNLLKGNVVTQVAANLPETMRLVVIG
jgi:nucleotide-binding universal stress UspA family protein